MKELRHYRLAGYLLVLILATLPIVGRADENITTVTKTFDTAGVVAGAELRLSGGAKLAVYPNIVPVDTVITFARTSDPTPTIPKKNTTQGALYKIETVGTTAWSSAAKRTGTVILPTVAGTWVQRIWAYDLTTKKWQMLATNKKSATTLSAKAVVLNGYYAVLNDKQTVEGLASWYCRYSCSKRYPTLHGTSNDYPVGTMVTVTNLETKKAVKVKIISRWGKPAGRVIDLSYAAFAKIKGKNGGLARVQVTSSTAKVTTVSVKITASGVADPAPALSVTPKGTITRPGSSVAAYSVIDEGSGTVLAEKFGTTTRPMASITKLMTAAVFIDSKIDFTKKVTFQVRDKEICACAGLELGEQMTARDALSVLLVKSANDAANMLVRLSGLTPDEFVRRMNAKAVAYGLTQTTYVDPHGLDPRNTSSTSDLAKFTSRVFRDYPLIRDISALPSYSFKPLNTAAVHKVDTADKLLTNGMMPATLTFAGGKTGYIGNASGLNFAVRFGLPNGARIIVAILGAPKGTTVQYSDAVALATWARNNYTWQ